MNKLVTQRDNTIDLLRFIGLSCIMLAHVYPPSTIFQLRTFDVTLMIFISGLSYAGRSISSYGQFVKKRVTRLLVPVYIFLVGFVAINFALAQFGVVEQLSGNKIIGSFLLQLNPSIGYLWIIRIFLIVMLVTPLLIKIDSMIKKNWLFIALIAALFACQFYLVSYLVPLKPGRFVNDYLLYLGYSIPFLLGIRIRSATLGFKWVIVALLTAVFIYMAANLSQENGTWLVMQRFKYPPQLYYLLWGCVVSTLLWATKEYWTRALDWRWIYFIAQNTIWIYLWHIPFVYLADEYFAEVNWAIRLIFIYTSATLVFCLQNRIVDIIGERGGDKRGYIKQFFKG